MLNFRAAKKASEETIVVSLGPSCFRDYVAMKEFADDNKKPEDYGLTNEDVELLKREVHVMSSFPVLVVQDYIVMGRKSWKVLASGAEKISFPGAGYLKLNRDTFVYDGIRYTRHLTQIIRRELEEETSVKEEEMRYIRALAIAEDTFKGSHRNPAIFSIVFTDISKDEIKKRKGLAIDAWEHEGPFIFVPKDDPALFEALLNSDVNILNIPINDKYAKRVDGLGRTRNIDTTGKAGFMLYLLGRYLYGMQWFNKILERHLPFVKLETEVTTIQ